MTAATLRDVFLTFIIPLVEVEHSRVTAVRPYYLLTLHHSRGELELASAFLNSQLFTSLMLSC
jgi:hypothetical protein